MRECALDHCEEHVLSWLDSRFCSVWHRVVARRHAEGLPAPAWPVVRTST